MAWHGSQHYQRRSTLSHLPRGDSWRTSRRPAHAPEDRSVERSMAAQPRCLGAPSASRRWGARTVELSASAARPSPRRGHRTKPRSRCRRDGPGCEYHVGRDRPFPPVASSSRPTRQRRWSDRRVVGRRGSTGTGHHYGGREYGGEAQCRDVDDDASAGARADGKFSAPLAFLRLSARPPPSWHGHDHTMSMMPAATTVASPRGAPDQTPTGHPAGVP